MRESICEARRAVEKVETPFAAIERKIAELAGMVTSLKREKEVLAAQLAQKSAEAAELARTVSELTRDRSEVRDRVETILSRLESIEL
jgi:chromosome segregation ATPase